MNVTLLTYTPNPEKIIASAAKLCYSDSTIDELMNNILENDLDSFIHMLHEIGHESPFEHASFTFAIEGVSRVTEQHLTRHRLASYSIQSGRYVNRSNGKLTYPPAISRNERAKKLFDESMKKALESYKEIIELLIEGYTLSYLDEHPDFTRLDDDKIRKKVEKKAFEDARYILPNGISTTIIFTMNVRQLFHFFKLRICHRSQWEIQTIAKDMLDLCREISPTLFSRSGAPCISGKCDQGKMSCGKPY